MKVSTPDQPRLEPVETALEPVAVAPVGMFERLALDPNVPVEKLERLIAMQERINALNAKAAFDAAYAAMQPEIPEIDERGQIVVKGTLQSTYARNEDIQKVLKPILAKHGFSLRFRVEWPTEKRVRVIGILAHREGHAEQSEFLSDADSSGNKNAIQGLGSAISYGHRYATADLLNITSRGQDDDGSRAGVRHQADSRPTPSGFDDWLMDMEVVAEEGTVKLQAAWNRSLAEHRAYLIGTDKATWERLKAKAAQVVA